MENNWKFELIGKHRSFYSIRKLNKLLKKNLWDVHYCPLCGSDDISIIIIWDNYRVNDIDAYKVTCMDCDRVTIIEGPFYP